MKLRVAVNHVCFHLVTQFYTPLYTNVYWALFSSVYYNFSWLFLNFIFLSFTCLEVSQKCLNLRKECKSKLIFSRLIFLILPKSSHEIYWYSLSVYRPYFLLLSKCFCQQAWVADNTYQWVGSKSFWWTVKCPTHVGGIVCKTWANPWQQK